MIFSFLSIFSAPILLHLSVRTAFIDSVIELVCPLFYFIEKPFNLIPYRFYIVLFINDNLFAFLDTYDA